MKGKRFTRTFWGRGFLCLLGVFLLFTIISKAASSFTVARVCVSGTSARKIRHIVTASGRVEKKREISVACQPDIRVDNIRVDVGERVKKGKVLAVLDKNDLAEQIADVQGDIKALELQNEAFLKNQKKEKKPKQADPTVQVNNIAIEKYVRQRNKLEKLMRGKGKIRAPRNGVITSVLVTAGQKTADTGLFTMTDDRAGFLLEVSLTPDQAKYVSPGDKVKLKTSDGGESEQTVSSLEADENNEFLLAGVNVPAKKFSLGETVTMTVVQESKNYSCTVPLTALRQENNRYFVLVVEERSGVMGQQMEAVREDVNVLEENETVAALESGTLSEESRIIVDTDRYVKAGDRIRLQEE